MEQNFVEKGWQCPVCGAVMSPRERVCVNCKGNTNIGVSIPNITIPAPYIGDVPNNPYGPYGIPLGGTTSTPPPNFVNTISGVYNAENDNKE